MFLSDLSIKRPVAVCCFLIGMMLLGMNSYRKMGVEFLPKMDTPFVTVTTTYAGATPEEIETDVAKKIEDAVVSIEGLKHVTSSCMENACQTTIEFELGIDADVAAADVRDKIDQILNDFPDDVDKPKVVKFDVNASAVVNLALAGDVPLDDLYDYADNRLKDRLSVLRGVANVELVGGAEREVTVLLDREKLAARGLTSLAVISAIQEGISTIPSGRIRQNGLEYSVKFDADYDSINDIGFLEIAGSDGQRCYIRDVGTVKWSTEELRQTATLNGKQAIAVKVVKKSDANAVAVVDRVREAVDKIRGEIPGGMELAWVDDDGEFIQASADSAVDSIVQGVILTAIILFFFLYNIRSTLIVAITMPLTIVISLFFLQGLSYTLNNSTLLAIGLSIGILVTNSIVVLEAIVKRFDEGKTAKEAASLGSKEVALAVVASAATNLVVLFPIAFMGSLVGQFFRPFATTMIIVTLVSLFISFTLTPILSSILLKRRKKGGRFDLLGKVEKIFNHNLGLLGRAYARVIRILGHHKVLAVIVLAGVAVFFVTSMSLAGKLGFSFFPDTDRGRFFIKLEYPPQTDLKTTIEQVTSVEDKLKTLRGLKYILTTSGKVEGTIGQSSEGVYLSQLLLKFVDKFEREESMEDILAVLRDTTSTVPGAIVTVSIPSAIGGQESPLQLEIAGDDLKELDDLAIKVKELSSGVAGLVDTDTSVRAGKPEIKIRPRRAVLADLGIASTNLGTMLRGNLEGIEAGTFKKNARTYDIRVKFDEKRGREQIEQFRFPGAPGTPVNLQNLASVEEHKVPILITRKDKRRISKFYSNLKGKPLGTAVNELGAVIANADIMPSGYDYVFAGQYERMAEAGAAFLEAALIAGLLTYLVLAAILESFTQPFIILVTLPLGLIGVLWGLFLAGESISMFVLLGSVMLIGIVVNNAILIMGQVQMHIREGIPAREAMVHAIADEFRPILMITFAAVLGMLPLALGAGLGSEMRTGIGWASAGGIMVSAALTMLVLPVLYDIFTRDVEATPIDVE